MKLRQLFETLSSETLNDLDIFLGIPGQVLRQETIDELKGAFPSSSVKVFRILFMDDESVLAKELGVESLKIGNAIHKSHRATSWSTSKNVVMKMAEEDFLDSGYVILEALIEQKDVVLDTTKLTPSQLLTIRGDSEYLAGVVRSQKEVIVSPGVLPCKIVYINTENI